MDFRLGMVLPPLSHEKWCIFNGFGFGFFFLFNVCFKKVHLSLLMCSFFFDGFTMWSSCARFVQVTLWGGTLSIQGLGISGNHSALYNGLGMPYGITLRFSLLE